MTSRREFLQISAASLAAVSLSLPAATGRAVRPLKLLFLGGTGFIGPHQIRHALERGHQVTMFNRGSKPNPYGDAVEELIGNRDPEVDAGLSALEGERRWDVVIDNSGYVPRHVRASAELLRDRCDRYLYVSTVAVYDFSTGGELREDSPMAVLEDPSVEKVTGQTYGPLKAECDREVQRILGDRVTVVRPTYIVGPGDHTDRFTYYVDRVHRGGDMLAPAGPSWAVQWVDVRDLCPWIITLAENGTPGIFNAAGPASAVDRAGFLWGLRATTDAPVTFHWPDTGLLEEMGIDFPMMSNRSENVSFANQASMAAGLNYRSLADTALGTLEWWRAQSDERRANARRWPDETITAEAIARLKSSG